ncbi:tetratricopeptide repeat protein, partial [bacterium]|nr:tetratricopeptide repeat protein [bacterium]
MFKKNINFIVILLFIPFLFGFSLFEKNSGEVEDGNSYFKNGKYDKAIEKFQEALEKLKQNPSIYYHIGNSLYKKEQYSEAKDSYIKSLASDDKKLRDNALYNLGNSFFKMQDYKQALDYYKKYAKNSPTDKDVKKNIEITLKMLEQQNQNKNNKDGQKEENQEQNKDQQEQNKDQKEQNKDQKEQNKDQKEQNKDQQEQNKDQQEQNKDQQ